MLLARDATVDAQVRTGRLMEVVDAPEHGAMPFPPLLQGAADPAVRLPVDRERKGVEIVRRLDDIISAEQHDPLEGPPP
ncbi:hypothetical protein ACFYXD_11010 [Streptomyces platensis]|uniref:hypothetical protein n=1 Tax=Streptomyces platensis TaxID=58346 RepID=UPI0036D118B3